MGRVGKGKGLTEATADGTTTFALPESYKGPPDSCYGALFVSECPGPRVVTAWRTIDERWQQATGRVP